MPLFHPPQKHYTGEIQPIDFMESSFAPEEYEGYLKGNIIKYVSRYQKKDGLADLSKATVYLTWLMEHVEKRK